MSLAKGGSDCKGGGKRKRETAGGDGYSTCMTNIRHNGDEKTTLGSLLKYMEGYEVIVELKTGKRHRGRLASADDNMNLMLEEEQEDQQGETLTEIKKGSGDKISPNNISIPFTRNIRGSKIRYVHFPDNANLPMLVRSGRERERNAAKKYQKTKRSRK